MMRKISVILCFIFSTSVLAQKAAEPVIASGPMLGHVELRTATIWAQFSPEVKEASVAYIRKGGNWENAQRVLFTLDAGSGNNSAGYFGWINTGRTLLIHLEPGTTYSYRIFVNRRQEPVSSGEVTTQTLWQWRIPAPDFSFLAGSCTYFNETVYDRPGRPYGSDSSIFLSMAKEKADFMLWLGDNWYTREVDYFSEYGLFYRPARERAMKILQPFLKAMPHYAIWDDHDYGWNNSDKSYPLKNASRNAFKTFWANPSYGEKEEGIYSKITWNDVDVFLLDDRWFRSNDDMPDSVNGQPNSNKRMFGEQQMEWLKNALLQSNDNRNISFRIIANGSQVLNPVSPFDCLRHFPVEYHELMNFIQQNNISGVVFITGDRHHSEIIKIERPGNYPLYDITSSPLSSGISRPSGAERNNPYRVGTEISVQNYSRFSFSGEKENRRLLVEFLDMRGQKLAEWSITKKDLTPQQP